MEGEFVGIFSVLSVGTNDTVDVAISIGADEGFNVGMSVGANEGFNVGVLVGANECPDVGMELSRISLMTSSSVPTTSTILEISV